MEIAEAQENELLQSLSERFYEHNKIKAEDFSRFPVKKGLRNADGTGVMAGLTKICNVEGYYIDDGERIPKEGRLIYRGIDLAQFVNGCLSENRFREFDSLKNKKKPKSLYRA